MLHFLLQGPTMPFKRNQYTLPTGAMVSSVAIRDLNGDGRSDLVVAHEAKMTVTVFLNGQL